MTRVPTTGIILEQLLPWLLWVVFVLLGIQLLPQNPWHSLADHSLQTSVNFPVQISLVPFTASDLSWIHNQPTKMIVWAAAIKSLSLLITSLLIAVPSSLVLGSIFAVYSRSRSIQVIDQFLFVLSSAVPSAWICVILLSVSLWALPTGTEIRGSSPIAALVFALSHLGIWSRILKIQLAETMAKSDWFRAAKGRGIKSFPLFIRHAFYPSAFTPLAYFFTSVSRIILVGLVSEVILDIPGIGSLLLESYFQRDLPVLRAALLVSGFFIAVTNFISYWLHASHVTRTSK